MGLYLSPIITDLVLQEIESEVIKKYKNYIHCYTRYVDDSYIILNKRFFDKIFNMFNSLHGRIKFTCQIENNVNNVKKYFKNNVLAIDR